MASLGSSSFKVAQKSYIGPAQRERLALIGARVLQAPAAAALTGEDDALVAADAIGRADTVCGVDRQLSHP